MASRVRLSTYSPAIPGADHSPGKIVCEAHNDHFVGLAEGQTP